MSAAASHGLTRAPSERRRATGSEDAQARPDATNKLPPPSWMRQYRPAYPDPPFRDLVPTLPHLGVESVERSAH